MTTDNILMAGENSGYRLTPGQKVLNRYTLGRILGRGGMGVVWLARDDALDLDVALKFVPSLVVNDRGILSDLKRETRRNLALTHPNIVRTYDFVQDETLAGISMEYVDADTLRNRRLDQPTGVFSPEELGEWTLQLCEALQYAHESAGIVHRDLKPANLLINARKQLKVADFGISRSLGESVTMVTGRNTSIGTLPYMSPQQLDGEPTHPLDDIYAIGATLYELCTSRPPFVSGEISRQILLKVPPTMTDRRAELGIAGGPLPQNWESTVAACLAKDRAARPQSAREIAVRLGLKEAGAARTTSSKPLPITGKVALKPLVPAAAPTVALPVPMDWKTRSLDTVRRSRRAALEASTIGLDTCRRGGRRALEVSAAALERIKRDQRTAALASGIGLVALVLVLLGVRWLRGSHGDHPSAAQGVAASGKSAPGADRSGSHAGSLAPGGADVLSATAARGGIRIETDPPGASVQVDGAPAQKAPIVWNHLAAGQHTVSVALEGYDTFQTQVDVKANQTVDAPKIALARTGGTLDVTTDPPGADLIVRSTGPDATEFHSTSPWTSGKLPPGEYEVSATRPGWQPVVQRVSVTRDQAVPVDFKLTGGTVTINSSPAQATVLIDGKAVGVTPYTIQDAQPGELKYSLSLPGYGPTEVVGKVDAGQAVTLDAKMAAAVADGSKAGDGSKAAEDDDDDSAHAAKTAHSGDAHTTRHTTRTKKKTGNDGNEFLNALKKIPLPFWHH